MSTNNRKRLTTADLLSSSTKEIVISTGHSIVIRKIGLARIVEITKGIPDISNLAVDKIAKGEAKMGDASAGAKLVEEVMVEGVADPKLSLNGDGVTSARPCDFSTADYGLIFNEIMALSGWSKKEGKEVLPLSGTRGYSKP